MIEIPEAIHLAEQINQTLKNKRIKNIIAAYSHHTFTWYNGNPADYPKLFNGKIVKGAYAYGGKLHIKLSKDCVFMICDGINIRYITNQKPPKKHQLLIEFDDGTNLVCTTSMYGFLKGFVRECHDGYDEIAKCKPQVVSDAFDLEYFYSLLNGLNLSSYSAKSFLTTEQRIPGLGNGVLQDILFNASIAPKRKLDTFQAEDFETVHPVRNYMDSVKCCLSYTNCRQHFL